MTLKSAVTLLPLSFAALAAFTGGAAAQSWTPQRHVEIISPAGAGGSVDTAARAVERIIRESKLIPVSTAVTNRAGAEHALAYHYVKQRAGDPHVLSLATQVLVTNNISGILPINFRDLTPLAILLSEHYVFIVPPDSPIKSGRDFIELMKQKPDAISISIGNLAQRVAVSLVLKAAGVDPRKARVVTITGAKTSISVAGGHVDLGLAAPGQSLALIEGGKLRPIAVSGAQRLGGPLAQVPVWSEFGLNNATATAWRGVVAPPGLSPAQVEYWESVLRRVSESREFREAGERHLYDMRFMGAAEARKFMEAEEAQQKEIMALLGLIKQP
jgi:putative tricarboxylic transport membrane protein